MSRDQKDRPIEELQAGDDFRRSLIDKADDRRGSASLWHGWALMDSFLAGIDWARSQDEFSPTRPAGSADRYGVPMAEE